MYLNYNLIHIILTTLSHKKKSAHSFYFWISLYFYLILYISSAFPKFCVHLIVISYFYDIYIKRFPIWYPILSFLDKFYKKLNRELKIEADMNRAEALSLPKMGLDKVGNGWEPNQNAGLKAADIF